MRNTHVRFTAVDGAEIVVPIATLSLGRNTVSNRCEAGNGGPVGWTISLTTFDRLSRCVEPLECGDQDKPTTA